MPKSKYRKKKINGCEYWFYRFYDDRLTRGVKDIYGKTITEVDGKIRTLKSELDRGITSEKACFGDYLKKWLDTVHSIGKKKNTVDLYNGIYKNYVKDYPLAKIQLKRLTALEIQSHYERLVKEGVGKSTLVNVNKLIKPCIRYAAIQGKIPVDFSASIKLPDNKTKKENTRHKVRPLSHEEQAAFLKEASNSKWYTLFYTVLNTGLRIGEALALTWDDVDLDESFLTVNKAVDKKKNIISPKTENSVRTVPLPESLVNELKAYRGRQIEKRLKMGSIYHDNNLLFCNDDGTPITHSPAEKAIKRISNKMGIPLSFHDLRGTYATRLYEAGYNVKTAQAILGHSDIKTTLNIYTDVAENMKITNLDQLEKLQNSINAL